MTERSLKSTPPGRKFGPRGRQAATLTSATKEVTPERSAVRSVRPKDEDSEEELMLDENAMATSLSTQQANDHSQSSKQNRGQQTRGVQSRMFSRSKDHKSMPNDTPDEEMTNVSDTRRRQPEIESESACHISREFEDDSSSGDTIYTRKVHLGGNMKITCKFNTTSLPLTAEQPEAEEAKNAENEPERTKLNQRGRVSDQPKGPRGKLHTIIKAREKYDSGSSAGDDKLENFGRFASESHNWDPEMDQADYQLQTMVISSSRRRAGPARQEDEVKRDDEQQQLRRPRNAKFEPPQIEEEEFFWDEEVVEPKGEDRDAKGGWKKKGRVREKDEAVRDERGLPEREDRMKEKGKEQRAKPVKGRGPVGSRLRQDSESSEDTWNPPSRKSDRRVTRLRRESGNSRSSDDYPSDSDRLDEHHSKGGGILHLGGRSSPKAIPGNQTAKGPSHSPKPKDKQKDSRLWDPSKPKEMPALEPKPANTQLVFLDSDSDLQKSPADQGSYEYSSNYQGYNPNTYQPVQYQEYQQTTSQSWADQAEMSFAYSSTAVPPQSQNVPYGSYYGTPAQSMNFDPQQAAFMHGKRAKEQAAMQVVLEAANKETEFSNAVVIGVHSKENLQKILTIRQVMNST